jgi:hypothetical protein
MTIRRLGLALAVVLAMLSPVAVHAQLAPPAIITEGMDLLRTSGADAALDRWLKGWPPETIPSAKAPLLRAFEQVENVTGAVTGYDFLGTARWGPHTRRLYYTVLAKNRPFYMRFDVYLTGEEWRVLNVTLNTSPEDVFPPGFMMPPGF